MIPFVIPSEAKRSRGILKRSLHASRLWRDLVGMTVGVVFLLLTSSVNAQQVSLSISPPILELASSRVSRLWLPTGWETWVTQPF